MKRLVHTLYWLIFLGLVLMLFSNHVSAEQDFTQKRLRLVDLVEDEVIATRHYLQQDALDERVLEALRKVPRHAFVPDNQRSHAYENRPLSIGHGQTISQPYIVAVMTDLLKPQKNDRVLEIGTGSGYQAAILAELVDSVYSIEIIEPLAEQASKNLKDSGYAAVHTRIGDGYYGWESEAPFDSIVVTAAASQIPPPLIKQLKPGGRMIIPVGAPFTTQYLVLVTKGADEKITTRQMLPVAFVPLTGTH